MSRYAATVKGFEALGDPRLPEDEHQVLLLLRSGFHTKSNLAALLQEDADECRRLGDAFRDLVQRHDRIIRCVGPLIDRLVERGFVEASGAT